MGIKQPGIVIWCGKGANQKALANKIAAKFPVAGIVIDVGNRSVKKRSSQGLFSKIMDRFRFRKIYNAWTRLMEYYERTFPQWPAVPTIRMEGINQQETLEFTKKFNPELIVVSGTALIREPLLSIGARIGTINLHTGLSPYVKGGPNCTNWCIANGDWHLVGNTIMWLNAGIDAGNIITTESIDIRSSGNLDQAHRMVMDHAHDLYLKTISYLAATEPPYQSVSQDSIAKGNLYLTKMWTSEKKKQLLVNWGNKSSTELRQSVKTIPLLKN
jgi:methionyl-tRNA formyltransferase